MLRKTSLWPVLLLAVICSSLHADTHRWLGAADPVKQTTTITIAGSWATNEDWTGTINNKTIVVDIGTYSSDADVAEKIAAAIDASSATSGLIGNETRNRGGEEIAEWEEVDATFSSNVVTVTSATAGVPFSLSSATSASGTAVASTTVNATGPNHFDNDANWVNDAGANSAPDDGDTILFDSGSVDCLYNLDYSATMTDASLVVTTDYTGDIGLLRVNANGYAEYRSPRFLVLEQDGASPGSPTHKINSKGANIATGRRYIDCGSNAPSTSITVNVYDGPSATNDGASVQIVGGDEVYVNVTKGSVDVGTHPLENATSLEAVRMGYDGTKATDAVVRVGDNASWDNIGIFNGSLVLNGGTCYLEADCDGAANVIAIFGGTLTTDPGASLYTVDVYDGGTLDGRNTDINTLSIFGGGTVDFSRANDASSQLTDNVELYSGATYRDPKGITTASTFDLNGCGVQDITFLMQDGYRMDLTGL